VEEREGGGVNARGYVEQSSVDGEERFDVDKERLDLRLLEQMRLSQRVEEELDADAEILHIVALRLQQLIHHRSALLCSRLHGRHRRGGGGESGGQGPLTQYELLVHAWIDLG